MTCRHTVPPMASEAPADDADRTREKEYHVDTFITPIWYTKDVALNFDNELALLNQFDRSYDDSWVNKPEAVKIGDTVGVRIQQRFTVSEGQALQQQPIYNQTVPITINHQYHIDMGWSCAQDRLDVEEVQDRYTVPAGQSLASKWDLQGGAEVFKSVYFQVGAPGVPVNNAGFTQAQALLRSMAVPADFVAVLDPQSQADITNVNFALFNPQKMVSDWVENSRFASRVLGINDWHTDPLMPAFTTGTMSTASTPVVSGATQTGSTLNVSGLGTYAFVKGDTFTIAGVYAVNPVAYNTTRYLQSFTVTAAISGSSTAALAISPSIITSGQLQTVNASPANGAAIAFVGATGTVNCTMAAQTSVQNLVFNPAAFAFVMVDLPDKLPGAIAQRYKNKKEAISLRFVEQYSIQTDQLPSRMDTIGGVAPILPYYAVRYWS
jgi:P22 coat protein - gene protein 5